MNAIEARQLTESHLNPDIDLLVSAIERRALREHYESRGFKWHNNPKADHPCCRGLTTLSW